MKIFLDTNVLIAASVRQHPHFARADAILQRCVTREDEGIIHIHSVLEFHSAITQLPKGLAVPPAHVSTLLGDGLLPFLRCATLSPKEILAVQKRAGELGITGGGIYDLFHLAAAVNEGADRLYTFNTSHFRALADSRFVDRIVAP